MHEWAAINGWSRQETKLSPLSRPSTKMAATAHGRLSVAIPILTPLPRSGLRRCQTTLLGQAVNMQRQQVYKPRQSFVDSSTTHFIQYLKCSNKVMSS